MFLIKCGIVLFTWIARRAMTRHGSVGKVLDSLLQGWRFKSHLFTVKLVHAYCLQVSNVNLKKKKKCMQV